MILLHGALPPRSFTPIFIATLNKDKYNNNEVTQMTLTTCLRAIRVPFQLSCIALYGILYLYLLIHLFQLWAFYTSTF